VEVYTVGFDEALSDSTSAAANLACRARRLVRACLRAGARAHGDRSRRGALRSGQPRAVRDRRVELSADPDRTRHSTRRRRVIPAVAACRTFGAPLLPRGAGTSLAGQCCNVAVVLDFRL